MRKTIPAVFLSVALLFALPAVAQVTTADIVGRVSDTSGAVVPNATVTIKNPATGLTRTTKTDTNGDYSIVLLPIGVYDLTVQLQGFATVVQKDIELRLGRRLTLNFTLSPATVTQEITVTEEAPLVESTKSEIGGAVSGPEIRNLPLIGRTLADLAYVIPGNRPVGSFDPTKNRFGTISVNGGDGRNVDYEVDGGSNKDNVVGGVLQNVPLESVQEFTVSTGRFAAESGRSVGGVVNVITRSGSNELHGSFFAQFRDRSLRKQTFFENQTQKAGDCGVPGKDDCKPEFSRRELGGSIGGRIVKDKLFFFGAVEHFRERQSIIVDPTITADLKLVPGVQFVPTIPLPYDDTLDSIKVDHRANQKHSFSYRFSHQKNSSPNDQIETPANTDLSGGNTTANRLFSFVATHSYTISPTKLNQFSFYFQDFLNDILGVTTNPNVIFPSVQVGANVNVPQETTTRKWQFRDDFTWRYNRHNFKAGANWIYESLLGGFFFFGAKGYQIIFWDDPTIIVADPVHYPNKFATAGAVREIDFFDGDSSFNQKPHQVAFYFQDDFRVSNKLTLNLGIRWDANINFLNDQINNRTIRLLQKINHPVVSGDLTHGSASFKEFQPRFGFAYDPTGKGRTVIRGGYGIYRDQVFQNLTLFSLQQANPTIYQQILNIVAGAGPRDPAFSSETGPLKTFRFGTDPLPTAPAGANTDIEKGGFGRINDPNITDPYVQQFAIGASHEFGRDFVLSTDYLHALGIHESRVQNINPRIRTLCSSAFPGSNPSDPRCVRGSSTRLLDAAFVAAGLGAGRLEQTNMIGTTNRSRYDAWTTQIRKRFSHRTQFQASYVFSKSQSWGGRPTASYSGNGIATTPEIEFRPNEFGPTLNDERHRFVVSGLFEIPGGVHILPAVQWASARPYSLRTGTDIDGDGRTRNDRICVGTDPNSILPGKTTFPAGCTQIQVSSARGGILSDGSEAPGRIFQTNLRVLKSVKLRERFELRGYVDFINLFNTKNFGRNFQESASASNFRQPTALTADLNSGAAFVVQFGVRFQF